MSSKKLEHFDFIFSPRLVLVYWFVRRIHISQLDDLLRYGERALLEMDFFSKSLKWFYSRMRLIDSSCGNLRLTWLAGIVEKMMRLKSSQLIELLIAERSMRR